MSTTVSGRGFLDRLADIARAVGGAETIVLADRPDGAVVRSGAFVAKAHAEDTDEAALAARLRIAAHPRLEEILLAPVGGRRPPLDGRPVTIWPHHDPVGRDNPDAAPWEEAATLLARLHRVDPDEIPAPVPPMRGPAKLARALDRLLASGARAPEVWRAAADLPPWARAEAPPPPSRTVVHGDLHLGQLVRSQEGEWRLIDVDDLGIGDPGWDLARPAAWFATGLLAPEAWHRFLAAYQRAGGPAVPPDSDPWHALDVPARALTVQSAALAVVRAQGEDRPLDEVEQSLVDACGRIADIAHQGDVS